RCQVGKLNVFLLRCAVCALAISFLAVASSSAREFRAQKLSEAAAVAEDWGEDEAAFEIYTDLENKGDTQARFELARMYKEGRGTEKNPAEAVKRYLLVAEDANVHKSIWAKYFLGEAYAKGEGVKKDYKRAVGWYEQAAAANDFASQRALGMLYVNGFG